MWSEAQKSIYSSDTAYSYRGVGKKWFCAAGGGQTNELPAVQFKGGLVYLPMF